MSELRLLMAQQGGLQDRGLAVSLQTAEGLLGLQHRGACPAQGHPHIAPALDVAADLPEHRHQALDGIGATQRASQRIRQAETDDGEHLVEPFEDRRRDARRIAIEPARQVPEYPLRLLGRRAVPGLAACRT